MSGGPDGGGPVAASDLPDVPGLTLRHYRDESDILHFASVYAGCVQADAFEWMRDEGWYRNEFLNRANGEPSRDTIFAEVGGEVVGFAWYYWVLQADGSYTFWQHQLLLPEWRGRGILRAMLRSIEALARERLPELPSEGPASLRCFATDTERQQLAVLEGMGYTKDRYLFEMLRDLREEIVIFPLPEGIEVRPVSGPADHRRVYEATWNAYQGQWWWREMTEEDYQRYIGSPYHQPELWTVAWDGDEVAGLVLSWILPEENELFGRRWGYPDEVSVRAPYRRRGLAKALLSRALQLLRDRGMELANLGVDTGNPNQALHLYEAVGFKVHKEHWILMKPLEREAPGP